MSGQVYEGSYHHVSCTPPNISPLVGQFESRLEQLFDILRLLQETASFDWLDELMREQIHARWEIARDQAVMADNLPKLIEDLIRAEKEGEKQLYHWRTEHGNQSIVCGKIQQADLEIDGSASLTRRWVYLRKRAELKKEEARLASLLVTVETELLSAYSPYGEVFDYYIALRKEVENDPKPDKPEPKM